MPLGMPLWDGTKEMAEILNREFNAVLDALVDAGVWTGDPPYRDVSAAQQVRMLAQRAGGGTQERGIVSTHEWLILFSGKNNDKDVQLTAASDRVEFTIYAGGTIVGKQLNPSEAYGVSAWLHEWANEHGYPADQDDVRSQITELHSEYSAEVAAMQLRAEAAEARLAAVPVDAIGRYYFHSAVFLEENYGHKRAAADSDAINEWLIPRL